MKNFLSEDFLLKTKTASRLYHEFAENLPIVDFHSHLSPKHIADDINFKNLSQAWLSGDHYKWRAMRVNGVDESYCTGERSDEEKFEKWAETVPYTLRNPLYHWTHLELQRYFGIREILTPQSAKKIYDTCNEKLQSPEFSVRNLLLRMKVELVATTDDPVDPLEHHEKLRKERFAVKVLPTFRPDRTMETGDVMVFNQYISQLGKMTGEAITTYSHFISALKKRHDYFSSMGCCISDHGLEYLYSEENQQEQVADIFRLLREEQTITKRESLQFKSALLFEFAKWDHEKKWVQQYHLGALRKNNSRKISELGADTGWDSIGDFNHGKHLSRFLDRLHSSGNLAKTILYNSNPADNELMASMTGNFNDGSYPGKIQWGSAWWFLDQKEGMIKQINAISAMSLLSRFVGMVTDSRSFLSYPRHEYFRRILCDLFGDDVEAGELPGDIDWIGKIIQDICYNNAKNYFGC
ncbi:MAG: glucuronate isomerase [Ginsengibacter sp.]